MKIEIDENGDPEESDSWMEKELEKELEPAEFDSEPLEDLEVTPLFQRELPVEPRDETKELKERIESLQMELEMREDELRRANEKFLLVTAETDNYKKRLEREAGEAKKYAALTTVEALLPTLDNFHQALEAANSENTSLTSIQEGVKMVFEQLFSALAEHGLERISPVGLQFNPESSEAIQIVEDPTAGDGTVVAEFSPGYRFKDRVIRHAKVAVAKSSDPDSQDNAS